MIMSKVSIFSIQLSPSSVLKNSLNFIFSHQSAELGTFGELINFSASIVQHKVIAKKSIPDFHGLKCGLVLF